MPSLWRVLLRATLRPGAVIVIKEGLKTQNHYRKESGVPFLVEKVLSGLQKHTRSQIQTQGIHGKMHTSFITIASISL